MNPLSEYQAQRILELEDIQTKLIEQRDSLKAALNKIIKIRPPETAIRPWTTQTPENLLYQINIIATEAMARLV